MFIGIFLQIELFRLVEQIEHKSKYVNKFPPFDVA